MMMPRVQTVSSVYATSPPTSALLFQHCLEIAPADDERRAGALGLIFGDGEQRRLLAKAFEICAGESVGACGQLVEVHVQAERHLPAAETDDRAPIGRVRLGKANDIVEP